MRVRMVKPGQTGYIGAHDLYTYVPGRVPCIMKSMCTTSDEVIFGPALKVYHNPVTRDLEVTVPEGVRAIYHPGASISVDGYISVTMVLPDGRKIRGNQQIPDEFCQR